MVKTIPLSLIVCKLDLLCPIWVSIAPVYLDLEYGHKDYREEEVHPELFGHIFRNYIQILIIW